MPQKIDWSLKKIIVRDDLDLSTQAGEEFLTWKRQFNNFLRESGASEGIPWEARWAALESCVNAQTFKKIEALRMQLPVDDRTDMGRILTAVTEVAGATENVWIHRHKFNEFQQSSNQPFKLFYSELVTLASLCKFDEGLCDPDKQNVIDLFLLNKIVFSINDRSAKKKLFEERDLNLTKAIKIIEAYEDIQRTEETFASPFSVKSVINDEVSPMISHVARDNVKVERKEKTSKKQPQQFRKPDSRLLCSRCGYHHDFQRVCPAQGKKCNYCGSMGHFERMCFKKTTNSRQPNHAMHSSAIISHVGTQIEKVIVDVNTEAGGNHKVQFVIDTGSDWTVVNSRDLMRLGLTKQDLSNPTNQMKNTATATGQKMTPQGFVKAQLRYGDKQAVSNIVVFESVMNPLLSISALKDLDIVRINAQETSEVTPLVNEIVVPFDKGEVYFASTISQKADCDSREDAIKTQLIEEFNDVFETQPPMKGEQFKIVLQENATPCCVNKARKIPIAYEKALRDELDDLLKEGIISPVTQPTKWVNPIVVEPKKTNGQFNGKVRLCVDFRHLNRYCMREHYTSLSVIETVQKIQANDAQYFTTFDAWKGYHQIELDEESKLLTTFITPFGRFHYNRAPFGINSISEHYNRRMTEELHGLENTRKIVDDILIFSKSLDEHVSLVQTFLNRCRNSGIRLRMDKFVFAKSDENFAGVHLSQNGYKIQDKIFASIRDFKMPNCLKDLQSFQGMANQLAPFNKDLASALQPLRELFKKSNEAFVMDDVHVHAFERAKRILTSENVLAYYRPNAPMQLYTDASLKHGLGFVLKQEQSDRTWRPIQLRSRTLHDAETRYAPIELELQAIVYATSKCNVFLAGNDFVIFTDHRPLVTICNKRKLDEVANTRILRSLIKLMDYHFTVEYLPGTQNKIADTLSRYPVDTPDTNEVANLSLQQFHVNTARLVQAEEAECSFRLQRIQDAAAEDVEYQLLKTQILQGFPPDKSKLPHALRPYWNVRNDLLISDDGFVLKGTRLLIPKSLRQSVLIALHAGHRGIEGSKARARLIVYWPQIDNDIENSCRSCQECERDRPSNPRQPLKHLPLPRYAFQFISADWFDLNSDKFLVLVDWYSGYFEVKGPVHNPDANTVIGYLREWFVNNAVCDYFWSDGGPPFGSAEMRDFFSRWGVKWTPSSPWFPQGNSMAESAVKWAKNLLRKCWKRKGQSLRMNEEWVKGILQWKNTPHKSTGLSPAMMLYGHSVQDAVPCHKSALTRAWHDEKLRIDREAATRKQKLEVYYNRSTRPLPPLNVRDPVCIQNAVTKRWDRNGIILERYDNARRYLIKLESGMIIRRNRIHLRKRFVDCNLEQNVVPTLATPYVIPEPRNVIGDSSAQDVASHRRSSRERKPPHKYNEYVM